MKTFRKLGILVSSERHLDKIIKLCEAAEEKGVEVMIFFTHRGTLLAQDPRFSELEGRARISLCRVSFESQGGMKSPIERIDEIDFGTQARNVEMIEKCDRYLVF
jgi:predicted nicotinamide N-methyase